uniref:Uncharacterized protein n=1 Tax=Panagrolaimus superbus TaxID=310955 RepID=A0A914Y5A2_9BILA
MDTAEKMEESSKNEGEKNEITQRFSKTYLSKVDISDETKNDSAPLKLKIEELVKQLQSKYDETKINAVVEIRRMLSANLSDQRKPPIDEIIENGIVPILIEDLKVSNEILRFEILWILTNIASGTFEQTKVIIDSGAVPLFLHFLHSTDHNIADQAAWLFGNIIADKTQFYNYCIEFGFIEEILKFDFEKLRIKNLQTITWIMANLCRNKELCPEKNIGKLFSPILELLVYNSDTGILDQTLLTITFLTDPNDQQRITLKDTVSVLVI